MSQRGFPFIDQHGSTTPEVPLACEQDRECWKSTWDQYYGNCGRDIAHAVPDVRRVPRTVESKFARLSARHNAEEISGCHIAMADLLERCMQLRNLLRCTPVTTSFKFAQAPLESYGRMMHH